MFCKKLMHNFLVGSQLPEPKNKSRKISLLKRSLQIKREHQMLKQIFYKAKRYLKKIFVVKTIAKNPYLTYLLHNQ